MHSMHSSQWVIKALCQTSPSLQIFGLHTHIHIHTHTHTHTHTYIYVPSVIKVAWWGLESQYTLQDIILLYGVRGEDS